MKFVSSVIWLKLKFVSSFFWLMLYCQVRFWNLWFAFQWNSIIEIPHRKEDQSACFVSVYFVELSMLRSTQPFNANAQHKCDLFDVFFFFLLIRSFMAHWIEFPLRSSVAKMFMPSINKTELLLHIWLPRRKSNKAKRLSNKIELNGIKS